MKNANPRALLFLAICAFFAILLSRLLVTRLFAADLPFWDQWDSEGWLLLRPFQSGAFPWDILLSPHNEHRVLFTRLTTLLLFVLNNHQWDNLVSLTFNAIAYALFFAVLVHRLMRELPWPAYATLLGACVLIACLPLASESLLSGFQNQFYFMIVFTVSGIWIAASRPLNAVRTLILSLLAVACVFTIASGLLSGLFFAAAAWLRRYSPTLRSVESPSSDRSDFWYLAILSCWATLVSAIAYWKVPVIPGHSGLHAQNLQEFAAAATTAMAWPLPGKIWCALAVWSPFLLHSVRLLQRRMSMERVDICALALAAWVVAQTLAMAHSRGHDLSEVPSRYCDIVGLGVLANVFLATRLFTITRPSGALAAAGLAALCALYTGGLTYRTLSAIGELQNRAALSRIEIEHVRRFVDTGDVSEFQNQPFLHIPYPDPARLAMMLSDRAIRAMLPIGVRPGIGAAGNTTFMAEGFYPATAGDHLSHVVGSYSPQSGDANQGELWSEYRSSTFPYLAIDVAGYLGSPGLSLSLTTANTGDETAVTPAAAPREAWNLLFTVTPREAFRIHAIDNSASSWFAFSEPVESGRLSLWVHWLLDNVIKICGVFLLLFVFMGTFVWYRGYGATVVRLSNSAE